MGTSQRRKTQHTEPKYGHYRLGLLSEPPSIHGIGGDPEIPGLSRTA